jgi:mycothiol synthase
MIWPVSKTDHIPAIEVPEGYSLRNYHPGDETRFYELMNLAGWDNWSDGTLQPWLAKIIPDGWYMLIHDLTEKIVCTAMALHNYKEIYPFCGELGWLAGDPEHSRKRLGAAASAAVVRRLINAGYRKIQLFTEDYRLPAIKTYLLVGFVPSLYLEGMEDRWRGLCENLDWPFRPENWQSDDLNQIGT